MYKHTSTQVVKTTTTASASMYKQVYKPYQRTGNICLDSLLATAHLMGSTAISYSGGVMSCTYQGQRYAIPVNPSTRCTAIIAALRQPPAPPAGERSTDPAAWSAQLAA